MQPVTLDADGQPRAQRGDLLRGVFARLLKAAGVRVTPVPEHVRLQRRGGLTFAFNFGDEPWDADVAETAKFHLGSRSVPPRGVACWDAPS